MELRWLYYPQGIGIPSGYGLYLGDGPQRFALVLEYREGVTHDVPWSPVPMTVYHPPRGGNS